MGALSGKNSDRIRSGEVKAQTKVDRPNHENTKSNTPHEGHSMTGRKKK